MPTRTDLTQERDSLERQKQQHRKNLFRLQEQKARHGLTVPLLLLNEIEAAEENIKQIEARLREIEEQLAGLPLAPQLATRSGPTGAAGIASRRQPDQALTPPPSQPTVFISYSHRDEAEKNELVSHLGVLQGAGLIETWVDDRIGAGSDWAADIEQAMSRARVAILLITKNFLNSNFILKTEVPRLLARRRDRGLVVFPVIARPCAWRRVGWLAQMNVRPKNGAPIWREGGLYVDEDLAAIAEEVADIIEGAS